MRAVVWIVAGLVGCADHTTDPNVDPYCGNGYADPHEECDDPGVGYCSEACTLLPQPVSFSWLFSTLDGTSQTTCLPGAPDVVVHLQGDHRVSCASGHTEFTAKLFGPTVWSMTCDTDHEWIQHGSLITSPDATAVFYTDVGQLTATWTVMTSDGTLVSCAGDNIELSLDGVVVSQTSCGPQQHAVLMNVPIGTHTLAARTLNRNGALVGTAPPVEVEVLASANVDGALVVEGN